MSSAFPIAMVKNSHTIKGETDNVWVPNDNHRVPVIDVLYKPTSPTTSSSIYTTPTGPNTTSASTMFNAGNTYSSTYLGLNISTKNQQ